MSDTLFTKIIRGDIPSHKVYEDEKTFVFLDIEPVQKGHTLVIPKNPLEFVWDLPDDDYQAVMATAKQVALRLRAVLGTKYVAERVIGVHVPHAHVQLIPFDQAGQLDSPPQSADQDELAQLAKALAF